MTLKPSSFDGVNDHIRRELDALQTELGVAPPPPRPEVTTMPEIDASPDKPAVEAEPVARSPEFIRGAQAVLAHIEFRAANHFHGIKSINAHCMREAELVTDWVEDAVHSVLRTPIEVRIDPTDLAMKLRDAADDPMWTGHAEVSKTLLREAAAALTVGQPVFSATHEPRHEFPALYELLDQLDKDAGSLTQARQLVALRDQVQRVVQKLGLARASLADATRQVEEGAATSAPFTEPEVAAWAERNGIRGHASDELRLAMQDAATLRSAGPVSSANASTETAAGAALG